MAEYRIMVLNDTTIKAFSDGRIHTLFTYKDGRDKWIERTNKPNMHGYIEIRIGGKSYKAHRLIMMTFAGESDQEVDHINRIKTDNRFENLRYCTRRENTLNRDWVDNAKGYSSFKNKWQARININNKRKYLGCFYTEAEAHQAYLDAKLKYHNEL